MSKSTVDSSGIRTDSPTCDVEVLNLLFSWAACEKLYAKSGDITTAYFQGKPLDRQILLKPPPGGLPDLDVSEDTLWVA